MHDVDGPGPLTLEEDGSYPSEAPAHLIAMAVGLLAVVLGLVLEEGTAVVVGGPVFVIAAIGFVLGPVADRRERRRRDAARTFEARDDRYDDLGPRSR